MLKINKKENKLPINTEKYNSLLNNLLDIKSHGDNAIFYHLSKINQDLLKIVKKEHIQTIFNNAEFNIEITSMFNDSQISRINELKNYEEFSQWAEECGYKPSKKIDEDLKKSFKKNLGPVAEKLTNAHNNLIKEWKLNDNKIQEIYTEVGVWPLYIGTFFIGYAKNDQYCYAPLILKEVNIKIHNGKIYLINRSSDILLNEKMLFAISKMLNKKIDVSDIKLSDISIKKAVIELRKHLTEFVLDDLVKEEDLLTPFKENDKDSLSSKFVSPTVTKGIVLSVCHPQGTKLRSALEKLIYDGKIDKLVESDILTNKENAVEKDIIEKARLVRVAKTDFSQEKAIQMALNDSVIIAGPPGTGKSQTIANIIVNILNNDKKALFISQKKSALDVVLKRMGKYSDLVFQFNESNRANKFEKEFFYKPIMRLWREVQDSNENEKIVKSHEKFIFDEELDYFEAKNALGQFTERELDAYFRIKKVDTLNEDKKDIKKLQRTINNYESMIQFRSVYNWYIKTYLKTKFFRRFNEAKTFFKNSKLFKFKTAIKDKPETMIQDWLKINKYLRWIKQIYRLQKRLYKYNIEDLIVISSINKFNTFKSFDKVQARFKSFTDSKNDSNVTWDELENMYKRVVTNIKKTANNFTQSEKNELTEFIAKVNRGISSPQLLTSEYNTLIKKLYNVFVGNPEILSNFIDFDNDKFDYIIFDESSQIFFEKALPYISCLTQDNKGRVTGKVIIAGDDQQMQPTNWFNSRDESEDEYSKQEVKSLLDWASSMAIQKIFLEMNYRSNSSELILFSSKEFYESKLKGLDKYGYTEKHCFEVVNVNGKWKDNKNIEEARKVVDLALENINKYDSMIILAFNKKQQNFIREIIAGQAPELYSQLEDKILLRNLENIQGDEADLVIVSVGYTKDSTLSSTYIGTKGGKNALNVAITRAKDKMIVVKSIYESDILVDNTGSANLYTFKKWLKFLDLSSAEQKSYTSLNNKLIQHVSPNFKNTIMNWLKTIRFDKDVEFISDYRVGSYTIDIAIVDKSTRKFLIGLALDDTSCYIEVEDVLKLKLKDDFIKSKEYPIYTISNFRFREDANAIQKYLLTVVNQ